MVITASVLAALILGLMQLWAGDVLASLKSFADIDMLEVSLRIEKIADSAASAVLTSELIERLFNLFYTVAVSLMVLKFLWKGFQIYVLWRDGDSDVSPHNMLIGALLAIAVCVAFPTLYNIATDITCDIGTSVINIIDPGSVLPKTEEEVEAEAQAEFQRLAETIDLDGNYELDYWEIAEYLDTDGDGEVSAEELVPYLDDNGDGVVDVYEMDGWNAFYQSQLSISVGTYTTDYKAEHLSDFKEVESLNILETLAIYIYYIVFLIMWMRLMGRGVEMLFMRVGLPLAAIGLIDSDGGVFKSYTQLMSRQMLTSIFQVAALRLSLLFLPNLSFTGLLLSIAILLAAFRTPKLLQQIMTPQGGGSGFGAKVYQGAMVLRMLKK